MELMSPTEHELRIRDDMVKRITQLAYRTFGSEMRSDDADAGGGNNSNNGSSGGIQVFPFGSQVTGLCLPGSDIDFVIRLPKKKGRKKKKKSNDDDDDGNNMIDGENGKEKGQEEEDEGDDQDWMTTTSNPLEKFADAVKAEFGVRSELETDDTTHTDDDNHSNNNDNQREYLSYLEVITQTRVPLVKFTVEPYNLDIDICFDQPHGPESADLMHRFMESMPPLRPLTFCLKYFLASREINKPFTGGVGSYLLQLMIVSFLQHRSRSDLNRGYGGSGRHFNLGSLLLDFLELYGLDFNYVTTAISVRHDGYYFPKGQLDKKEYFWQPHRPMSIAVENPLDSTMDVGSGAYRIQMISRVFEHAFKTLLAYVSEPLEQSEDGSILARILPPTEEMEKRRALKEEIRNKKMKNDGGEGEGAAAGMDTKNGSSDVTTASSSEKQRGVKRSNNDKSKKNSSSSSTNWDKHKKNKNKNRDHGSKKRRHSGGSSSAGGDGGGSSGGKWKNKNKKKRYSN
jgi:non-canonical poly(A) RNA polymerase PAPD5/7